MKTINSSYKKKPLSQKRSDEILVIVYDFDVNFLYYLTQFVLLPNPLLFQFVCALYCVLVYQSWYHFVLSELPRLYCQRLCRIYLCPFYWLKIIQRVTFRRIHNKIVLNTHQNLVKNTCKNQYILLQYLFIFRKLGSIYFPRLSQSVIY